MADAFTPVALGIKPPDPLQGINAYSGILGLQQQRQALQTGQYQQQSAQATASQDQQKNRELQAVSGLMQNVHGGGYRKNDGTFDEQKFADDVQAIAPVYGQDVAASARSQANEIVRNQKAKQDLTDEARTSLGSKLSALARDPNTRRGDVIDAYTGWMQDHKDDPAAMRVGIAQAALLPQNDSDPKYRETLGRYAASLTGQATTAPSSVDTGAQTIPGVTSSVTGEFTPAHGNLSLTPQGGIPKELSPTDQPNYKQAAAAATATGASRASGVASSDIERANQVSANIKSAQAGIQTTQQIDDLADQIHSGKFAGWLSKQAAAAGIQESTYARQLLEKDLGIVKTQLTSAAPSDSRAATILSGTPEATSDPQTIHGAMDYVRGSFRQNLAQGQNLIAYKNKHPDLSGFQGADDAFTGGGGPLVHEFLSLKGKNAQAAFYRRNFSSPEQAVQFRNQTRAAAHTLGLDNANR